MATHSNILAWGNPRIKGAWRATVHGSSKSWTQLSDFTFTHWRRKWQPTPVLLPGESQGRGSLVGCRLWGHTESTGLKQLSSSSSRLFYPWNSPGKNTGMGCHSLIQEIFLTQGFNPGLPHCRQILCYLNHLGSPPALQGRFLTTGLPGKSPSPIFFLTPSSPSNWSQEDYPVWTSTVGFSGSPSRRGVREESEIRCVVGSALDTG